MGLASKVNAGGGGGAAPAGGSSAPPSAPPAPGGPAPGQSSQQPAASASFPPAAQPYAVSGSAVSAPYSQPQQQQQGWYPSVQSAQPGYSQPSHMQPSYPQPTYSQSVGLPPYQQQPQWQQPQQYQQPGYGQPQQQQYGYPSAAAYSGGYPPVSGQQGPPRPGQQPGGYPGGPPPQGQQPGGFGAPPQGQQPGGYPPQGQQPGYPGQQPGGAPRPGGFPGQHPPPGQQPPYGQAQGGGYSAPQQQSGPYGAPPQQGGYGGPPQQGGYGAAPQQHGGANANYAGVNNLMGGPGSAGSVMPVVQQKLQKMVQTNRLEAFYPPQALQRVFQRLDCVKFADLSRQWSMPLELATDLAQLALYDIVIFADDSGSMVFEERGERIDDLKLILGRVAEVATLFDDDGILVRFMNNNVEGNGIRDATSAQQLVSQVQFNGMTPLGANLESKVIRPFLASGLQKRDLQKPILVIVITDGEPVGEPHGTVKRVIQQAKQAAAMSPYGPGAISFEFAQVGKDQKAQRFLGELDNDPEIGNIVDATSYYELEAEEYARKGVTLTPELWLVKLMVGAIDPSYDEQDE